MSLETDGFLDNNFIKPDFPPDSSEAVHLSLALDLSRFLMQVIASVRPTPDSSWELIGPALLCRLTQDFQACILLANNGFRAQSRSMARATFESATHCLGAAKNIELRNVSKESKALTYSEALIRANEKYRRVVSQEITGIDETPASIKAKMSKLAGELLGENTSIDLKTLAEALSIESLYTILYRPLSQDAHPTATSVSHHMSPDDEYSYTFGPDYSEFADTLLAGIASALVGLEGFLEKWGTNDELSHASSLRARYKYLSRLFGPDEEH
ncbi:hypothetical protein GJ699_22890 [Duganella sp. FT80W]|uniref:Uncharacterized protein n=1 Tax=Duganella guangzhouensis TaxID=2666084 RepID=A0A6I2L4Z7_9BURK|nr:DUF5677 domain-containing protein [Duganella guangzhouensis]MRW92850.1 hypothetical protein [Duganella guangzhouensis]